MIQFVNDLNRTEIICYYQNDGMIVHTGGDDSMNDSWLSNSNDNQYSNDDMSVAAYSVGQWIDLDSIIFINEAGDYCTDIDIQEIGFSNRTQNALFGHGISSMRELALMKYIDLVQIGGLGEKSVDEIIESVKNRVIIFEFDLTYDKDDIDLMVQKIIDFYSPIIDEPLLKMKERELKSLTINLFKENRDIDIDCDEFMSIIAKNNPVKSLIQSIISNIVSEKIYYGISENMLLSLATRQNKKYELIVRDALDDMIQACGVRAVKEKYYRYKSFLREWIDTLDGKAKIALDCRCQGMTLEEIGNQIGLTRERVRQLIVHTLKKKPPLYEDDYAIFIEKFNFEREEFGLLFDASPYQINYLFLNSKRGSEDVQSFLNDDSVPSVFKERVSAAFKGKVLILDGECVPLKRDVLLRTLLETYFSDSECSIEEFENFYQTFLFKNGLEFQDALTFPSKRAFEARLSDYPYTLMKEGHKIRYYDTESVDINGLMEAVNIEQYQDMEISTLKLTRDYPEVMEQYDIRDEYELHNLIRKRITDLGKYSISVTRMPFVTIGNGDRTKQIEDLLIQLAPISNVALANEYENLYGVRADTVMANFFKPIDVYYHNGVFDIAQQDLSDNDFNALRNALTEDVYLWDEIANVYYSISKNPCPEAINAMTLKKLGFRVYSQYIVSADYSSADAYFTDALLRDKCIDLNELKQGLRSIQAFYQALSNLRDSLELIEVDRDVFYRYDYFAEQYSVESKDQLMKIGATVLADVDDTEYFSIDAIARDSLLEDQHLFNHNTCILNSLIRAQEEYKTSRITNVYLGTRKDNDLSQIGLINHVVNKYGEISVHDLQDILKQRYEIDLGKSRILYVVQESESLCYDDIFDYIVLSDNWTQNLGPVYLNESRYACDINERMLDIVGSDASIAKYYWQDKYIQFVDYCGMRGFFLMKDILQLDFRKLSEDASKLNISKGSISDIVDVFMAWVKGLSEERNDIEGDESILNLFFK